MRETNRNSCAIVPTIAGLLVEAESGVPQDGCRVAYKEAACLLLFSSSSSSTERFQNSLGHPDPFHCIVPISLVTVLAF